MEDTTLEEKSIREIAGNEELIQKFLHLHRFYLCNQITQLGLFYAYMISKNVLRPEDQDDAESHPIRLVKIGKFLDIVATKGPNGFRAFLEVLEYEHSHVYLHITKEKPRDPPIGWRPSQPTSLASMRHKKKMADLISDMSQDAEEKKRKNEILQQYIMEAEEDHRKEREKLKKDLKEITSQKADLQEANARYKAELDELRRTSCTNRDTIESMRQEISGLMAQRRQDKATISQEQSKSLAVRESQKEIAKATSGNVSGMSKDLETSRRALLREKNQDNVFLQTQLSTLKETESQLLGELNERKEDYNRLVLEYSKKEKECEELQKKLKYCEEEGSYYQSKSVDLATEYNALLDAYQRTKEVDEEDPIYRQNYRALRVPSDRDFSIYWKPNDSLPVPCAPSHVEPSEKTVDVPPPPPPRVGKSVPPVPTGGKCVVVIHAPSEVEETLYKKLLDLPCRRGPGSTNSRMFTTVEMEVSPCPEADMKRGASNGKVLHYEEKPQGGFVMLRTDRLKQVIEMSSQHVLLQMPRKKEYTIRMKEAGIKFIVLMVVVAQRPESQLTRSLRANLTRHDLTFVTVPESQLADIDDLSKKVLNKVQDVISRSTT